MTGCLNATARASEERNVCLYLGEGSEVRYANARLLLLCEKIEKRNINAPEIYSVTPDKEVLSETEKF
ncbi:MAG: hypothetical protein MJ102_09670 [Clostridia bacterium]|nr:hypothetical protein [Clostridia bacterium]